MFDYNRIWDGDAWVTLMTYEVINKTSGQHVATLDIAKIHDNEKEFRGGRFELFTDQPQEYKVSLRAPTSGDEMKYRNGKYFNWIAEQTEEKWSVELDYHSMGEIYMMFSFEDIVTAVMFKLVWYGYKW